MNPTPAPLHDIAGPVAIPDIPLPVALGAAAVVLALGLLGLWLVRHRSSVPHLAPRQRALAALETLRAAEASCYDFGVRASDILRSYIRDQHGIDATTRTSLEFLEALRSHSAFTENERASLAAFLEAADLLKFARAEAARDEIGQMLDTAVRLVRGEGEK